MGLVVRGERSIDWRVVVYSQVVVVGRNKAESYRRSRMDTISVNDPTPFP